MITLLARVLFIITITSIINACTTTPVTKPTPAQPLTSAIATYKKITLLLPLQGQWRKTSKAIYNGFLAAFYQDQRLNPDKMPITINIIDSSNGNIQDLYLQAVNLGSELIIGPLTKEELQKLAKTKNLTVPTIALNTLPNYRKLVVRNLYQFGLTNYDEVLQLTTRAEEAGFKSAIIITTANDWGKTLSADLTQNWQALGGQVVDTLAIQDIHALPISIGRLLGVADNHLRAKPKANKPSNKAPLAHRQDFDVIFLLAPTSTASIVVPLLKFYYPEYGLNIYATSASYRGNLASIKSHDLDGLIFCDMPWLLAPKQKLSPSLQELYDNINNLWPEEFSTYAPLYALGIDAYNIAKQFQDFLTNKDTKINGATGTLLLDKYNHIYRELNWAQMQQGSIVSLP